MYTVNLSKGRRRKVLQLYTSSLFNFVFMRQPVCFKINPITVDNFAAPFNCTPCGLRVRLYDGSDLKLFILVGRDRSAFFSWVVHRGSTDDFHLLQIPSGVVWQSRDHQLLRHTVYLLNLCLCFFIVLSRYFLINEGYHANRTSN